ncbi:MAG: beta-galactosidase, partial [Armatimonadetes bacterium]|nr:beta-galactosidase [Armatimonadota bacterium]
MGTTVLAAAVLVAFSGMGEVTVIGDFEGGDGLKGWQISPEARAQIVADHATRGKTAVHLSFPDGAGFLRLNGPMDWSAWELLKIDVYNPGDPFTMTFRCDDTQGKTISSWYHLIRSGASTIDISIRGLAEGIDLAHIAWCHIRVDPARPRACEVYMDNWRLARGEETEVWKPTIPPEQTPVEDDPTNLIPNSDFELGLHGWGSWGLWDGGEYRFGSGSGADAYSGRHSAAIYCVQKGRGGVFTELFTVPKAASYTLRVMAKGQQPGEILIGYEGKTARKWESAQVTTQWQQFSLTIDVPEGCEGRVYLCSRSSGTVFFDSAYFGAEGVQRPSPVALSGRPPRVELKGDKVFINGKPFFCRGMYRARPAELKGTAFNFVPGWDWRGGYEDVPDGIWVMPDLSGLARAHVLYQLPLAIAPLRTHPRVIGWYVCDEPDHEKWPVGPDEIKYATQVVHQEDPGRLTTVVVMPWAASNLYRFADSVDILATDSYPIRQQKPSPVLQVAQATDWAVRATRGKKPVWLVVQATAAATVGEEYAVTYLPIVHGADGILYWEYEDAKKDERIW